MENRMIEPKSEQHDVIYPEPLVDNSMIGENRSQLVVISRYIGIDLKSMDLDWGDGSSILWNLDYYTYVLLKGMNALNVSIKDGDI